MNNSMDLSDYVIIAFIAVVFAGGAIVVYRFMKGKF
jgi:hypothetical protein